MGRSTGSHLAKATTYYEEGNEKAKYWRRQMMEKLLAKFDSSEEEIKDILDKCWGRRIGQICLVKRRKIEYNKLYHL